MAFYKLTPLEAITWYREDMLSVKGLIYAFLAAKRKPGSKLIINSVKQFCSELGISERAFYKAKAQLAAAGKMHIEIAGRLAMWLSSSLPEEDFLSSTTEQTCSGTEQTCSGENQGINITEQTCSGTEQTCSGIEQTCSDSLHDGAVPLICIDLINRSSLDISLDQERTKEKETEIDFWNLEPENRTEDIASKDSSGCQILEDLPVNTEVALDDQFVPEARNENDYHVRTDKRHLLKYDRSRMEEVWQKFNLGVLPFIPPVDLKNLADYVMGEKVSLYRSSGVLGWTDTTRSQDINQGFLDFLLKSESHYFKNHQHVRAVIKNHEDNPRHWDTLVSRVDKWQDFLNNPETAIAEAIARGGSKQASELDNQISQQAAAVFAEKINQQEEEPLVDIEAIQAERKRLELRNEALKRFGLA
jgi:hypothetical protein